MAEFLSILVAWGRMSALLLLLTILNVNGLLFLHALVVDFHLSLCP
jgi:hypothetical protein